MTNLSEREMMVFSAARRLAPGERTKYLAQACVGDAGLRQRVEELLQAGEEAGDFLQEPAPGAQRGTNVAAAEFRSPSTENVGDRIGRYKLLQQIGEGGCGVVYMAEQQEPVRRRVALKVIKLGMDTKGVIARFEAERQALALMDHPHIARVLDGGATGTGRPYFVMELVRGIKITDYCDENNFSTDERLKLFTQVCQAIQHAHQKGVIHRDIKPSNILVADHDGVPVPKVIDFGVAKATTDQRLTDKTLFTAFEQFIGTPAYMSPEQARLSGLDIDTRTDIYSLGVLLYELLTGKTPLDQKELLARGPDEMRRTICEKEPVRPSTRLSTMQEGELTTTARHRRIDPPKLVHLLRGDLDWIVMKALEKDRTRRYQTANGLAMDVQRYLADEPVLARPPSNFYRFQKIARRNKLAFAAAGAVATALIVGMAASTGEYFKERKALERATAVSGLLQELLRSADPEGLKGSDYTVRQLLDDFSAGLTNQLPGQPEVEATVRLAIGWTYFRLGALSDAETNLRQAVALRRVALGPQHLQTLEAQQLLARLLVDAERKWQEGEKLSRATWEARRRLLGAEHRDSLDSQQAYAAALREAGHPEEAEPIERQVLQIRERVFGPDDPDTIGSLGTLGQVLEVRGAYAEAEHYIRETLARLQRTGCADKQDGIICVKELALLRLQQGDPAEAEKLLVEVRRRAIQRLGPDHLLTLHIQRVLARALAELGRLEEAESLCKETLNARRRGKTDQEAYGTARTLLYLGRVLVERGKLEEAEPLLQQALAFFRRDAASRTRPELAAQAANWLGAIQLARKNYAQAETLLLSDADPLFAPAAEMSPNERRLAVSTIVAFFQATGAPAQTVVWRKKLETLVPAARNPEAP